jgi:hypothetical protein
VVWDSAFCAGAHHFWARIEGSALQGPWNLVFFHLFLSWDKSCVGVLSGAPSQLFDDGSKLLMLVCAFLPLFASRWHCHFSMPSPFCRGFATAGLESQGQPGHYSLLKGFLGVAR